MSPETGTVEGADAVRTTATRPRVRIETRRCVVLDVAWRRVFFRHRAGPAYPTCQRGRF